jgi:hypothetical protein
MNILYEYLSKVWRISLEDTKRTIDVTSQLSVTPKDPIVAKDYGTNDRMLRCKRIREYFFMDTLYAAKHGGKSTPHLLSTVCDRQRICKRCADEKKRGKYSRP